MKNLKISDKELIEGAISGKSEYQQMLYQKYAGAMLTICRRYTRNMEEAEDVLQEVFVKVFLNLKNFRQESTLGYWIKKLTINALISSQRKKSNMIYPVDIDEMTHEIPSVTLPVENATIPMDTLLQMIEELPAGYRTVFNLREIDGYEFQEIAEMLQCSNATVRSQLFKAKKELKKKIEEWMKYEIK